MIWVYNFIHFYPDTRYWSRYSHAPNRFHDSKNGEPKLVVIGSYVFLPGNGTSGAAAVLEQQICGSGSDIGYPEFLLTLLANLLLHLWTNISSATKIENFY